MDLIDELDRVTGSGPEHCDVHRVVAAGRRALLRRRAGVAGASLVVVGILGGAGWATADGLHGGRDALVEDSAAAGVARGSTTPSSPEPVDGIERADPEIPLPLAPGMGAGFTPLGALWLEPGWTVADHVRAAPDTVAVEIVDGERRQWLLFHQGAEYHQADGQAPGGRDFRQWVDWVTSPGYPRRVSGEPDVTAGPGPSLGDGAE